MTDEKILSSQELIQMRQRVLDGYEPSEEELSLILKSLAFNRSAGMSRAKKPANVPLDLNALFSSDDKK